MTDLTFYGRDNPLVETFEFCPTVITESVAVAADGKPIVQEEAGSKSPYGKRMVLEGVFQRGGVENANKRVYPLKLWERLLGEKSKVMQRVKERAMLGHLEHPEDGTTDLNKAAILISGLRLKEDGVVWGQCVVLNTTAGKIIQELVDAGVKFGISSRGTGSVDGKGVVQEDYNVDTWDIVYNPSTPGAYPTMENTAKPDVTNESVVVVAPPANDTIVPALLPTGGTPREQTLSVAAQILAAGPEGVKSRTGLSDADDVAKAMSRVLGHANQHGELKTVDALWAHLLQIDPKYPAAKGKNEDAAPAPAAPVVAEEKPAVENTAPAAAPAAPAAPAVVEAPKADADAAAALLGEAKAEIEKLSKANAELSEKLLKMTADLETSAAIVKDLTEKVGSLQVENERKAKAVAEAAVVIAGLTSAKGAVRDAEAAKATPAVAEELATKPVGTVKESSEKPVEPAVTPRANLAERIRTRERVLEEKGLPVAALESDSDAGRVTESTVDRMPLSKGAKLAAAAIPKLRR